MPEDDNTLNNELAQAVKLLDGEVVVTPEVQAEVPEVVPEVVPETEVIPEETEIPVETEEQEAAKLPHGESSRLGRKVKRIEDTFAEAMAKIDSLTNVISQTSIAKPVEPDLDDEMPEIITTPEDVQKVIDIRDRQRTQAVQKENTIYHNQFATHRNEDPEMYDEVYQEMLKNHNVKHTGKPDIDADMNYLKAKNAVLSRKLVENSKPKPNVLSKTPPAVNVPSVSPVMAKQLNLSADEKNAAEVFGFNEDELKRIFG